MDYPIVLAIAGDVMLGRLVNRIIATKGFVYPWGNVLPILQKADLFLINLECALTAETQPWHDGEYKAFYFRAEPTVTATLRRGYVKFASLANNHICDFGTKGLLETLQVLDRAGIAHAGAGINLSAAQAPACLTVNGVRICIVAFADYPRAWAATPTSPGINYTPISLAPKDFAEVERVLATTRQQADLVIFSIHWGPNMRSRPTEIFQDFAHKVVTTGADIFWGHSAHLVQGIEFYQKKLILYDTGDFVDDYAVDMEQRNDLSALFLVQVKPPHIEGLELVPVHISNEQVNVAEGADRDWFVQRLTALCAEMGTEVRTSPGKLTVSILSKDHLERERRRSFNS